MPKHHHQHQAAGLRQIPAATPAFPGWLGYFLQAAVIVLAGWWVYSPALHGGWIWDDNMEILHRPLLRDPGGLWLAWLDTISPDYFPLKVVVQWVQWHLWHDHPFGYHVTNVGLHLLSSLLLWRLFKKLGLRLAWFGALLFALHPVAVESVAWISELKNVLSLPPLLLAMIAWLDYDERGRRADYFRALLYFLAAMLCKSSVVMFPVLLFLHAWWKRGRIRGGDCRAMAAFFVISLGLGLVTVWFQINRAIGSEVVPMGGWCARLAGAGFAAGFYLSKCVFPAGLLPIYPRWSVDPPAFLQVLPWLVLGAALSLLWIKRATWGRHAMLGAGCFLVNLAPVLGFIPMSYLRITQVADHFVYLPLVGLVGLAAAGAGAAGARLAAPLRPHFFVAMVLVPGLFAFQGHRYAGTFRDENDRWPYILQRNPESWIAHQNLGNALLRAGRAPEALGHFEEALRIRPGSAETHYNLGNALLALGRNAEAIERYQKAVRLNPGYAEAWNNFGSVLAQTGRLAEAMEKFEEAVQLQPDYADAQNNLGNILAQTGRVAEAIRHYEAAVRLKPDFADAHNNLGNAFGRMGRVSEAIGQYEEALRINPDYAAARHNLVRLWTLPQTTNPGN